MKRVLTCLVLLAVVLLPGCKSLEAGDLIGVNEADEYTFQNLTWGMTRAEAEQALGFPLNRTYEEAMLGAAEKPDRDLDNTVIMPDDAHAWVTVYGNAGFLQFQFREGRLIYAGIQFQKNPDTRYDRAKGNDHEALAQKLLEELTRQLGDGYVEGEENPPSLTMEEGRIVPAPAQPSAPAQPPEAAKHYKYTWENTTDSFINRVSLSWDLDDEGNMRIVGLSASGAPGSAGG